MSNNINVKQFTAGSCYSYILSSGGEALIVDPHISLKEDYLKYLRVSKLKLKYIVDTHTHADHFSLSAVLKKETGVAVIMHEKAVSEVADRRVKDNEEIALASAPIKFLYSPGHTDDSVSIYADGRLLTGDVLLIGSVGRTDFQNGSPESMFDTLQKFKNLPPDTVILPGHDYNENRSSTLAKEEAANQFLKEIDRDNFVKNMRSKVIPKPFNIDNIVRLNQKGSALELEMITPRQAYELAAKDPSVKLLDVRSPSEYDEIHIADSVNIPVSSLAGRMAELGQSKFKYIILCRTGTRSAMAADMLIQSGMTSVKVLDGGTIRWEKDGLPVIKGVVTMSLERQVRIIAGSLVLSGILLSWLVHWAFILMSLFVSCGLIYAGVTDNCMMGMLLMKLPYNKKQFKPRAGGGTCSVS